jgi:hypothetical protein
MIELFNNLKITKGFHLNPIGELISYNKNFKAQDAIILASTSTWRFRFSGFITLLELFHFFNSMK